MNIIELFESTIENNYSNTELRYLEITDVCLYTQKSLGT